MVFMECKTQLKSNITGEQLLTLSMDMGEKMIICGAEANRVEDTIRRICLAYGCTKVDVFSITSYLSTTIRLPDGTHDTQTRRIHSYSNNLDKLEYLNAISRHICNNTPAYNNIETEIADIKKTAISHGTCQYPDIYCQALPLPYFSEVPSATD